MVDTKTIKKGTALLYIVLLIYSSTMEFFSIPELNFSSMGYSVNGVLIAVGAAMFYVYSVFSNKKFVSLISLVLTIVAYGITIFSMIQAKMPLSEYSLGCYAYLGAALFFVISFLMPGEATLASEVSKLAKSNEPTLQNVNGNYFVCNYITGVKGAKNIYKSMSVLIIKNEVNSLEVNIKAPEEIKFVIDDSNIEKIVINKEMRVSVSDVQKEDHTVETQYLATVLVGSFGPIIGEQLAKNKGASTKASFDLMYKIEIYIKMKKSQVD